VFRDIQSRAPRVRFGQVHLFNNYYVGSKTAAVYKNSYSIGPGTNAKVLSNANVFEIAGAIFLKNADGFTRLGPTVLTVASMTTSIVFLGFAMRTLSMGSAYAIWTGVGVVGVAFLGIQMFGESSSPVRLVSISLIVAGVVSLKLME